MRVERALAVSSACVIAALVAFGATYPRFAERFSGASEPRPDAPSAPPASGAARGADTASLAGSAALATGKPLGARLTVRLTARQTVPSERLAWRQLSSAQRAALAPFAAQWDHFSEARQHKWLRIADRFYHLTPDARKRLQASLADWARMSPEQRRIARENYQIAKSVPPQARENAWKAYQTLPDEQKRRLAAADKARRPLVVSAPPSDGAEVKNISRLAKARRAQQQAASAPLSSTPVVPAAAPREETHPANDAGFAASRASAPVPLFGERAQ